MNLLTSDLKFNERYGEQIIAECVTNYRDNFLNDASNVTGTVRNCVNQFLAKGLKHTTDMKNSLQTTVDSAESTNKKAQRCLRLSHGHVHNNLPASHHLTDKGVQDCLSKVMYQLV